jgi:8-oxo-dGTP diphosphatase
MSHQNAQKLSSSPLDQSAERGGGDGLQADPWRKDMKFHYLARGIILEKGKVLLAHQKGAQNTFLPGGHIKIGEKAELALVREIKEEIGEKAIIKQFIGAVECCWIENDQGNHEINLLFEVHIPDLDSSEPPVSCESHLEFFWAKPKDLKAHNLLPDPLIECLMNWELGFRGYWGSSFEKVAFTSAEHTT